MGANGVLLKGALIKEGRLYNNFRIKGGAYWRGALIIGRALITVNTVLLIPNLFLSSSENLLLLRLTLHIHLTSLYAQVYIHLPHFTTIQHTTSDTSCVKLPFHPVWKHPGLTRITELVSAQPPTLNISQNSKTDPQLRNHYFQVSITSCGCKNLLHLKAGTSPSLPFNPLQRLSTHWL